VLRPCSEIDKNPVLPEGRHHVTDRLFGMLCRSSKWPHFQCPGCLISIPYRGATARNLRSEASPPACWRTFPPSPRAVRRRPGPRSRLQGCRSLPPPGCERAVEARRLEARWPPTVRICRPCPRRSPGSDTRRRSGDGVALPWLLDGSFFHFRLLHFVTVKYWAAPRLVPRPSACGSRRPLATNL
jgi:hypothetical protein